MHKLLAAVTVLTVSTTQADTIYVDVNCPGPGNGSEAEPYCSIQTAIDNAVDTDEIVVAPGIYFETINFLGKAVTLRSASGAAATTPFDESRASIGGVAPWQSTSISPPVASIRTLCNDDASTAATRSLGYGDSMASFGVQSAAHCTHPPQSERTLKPMLG